MDSQEVLNSIYEFETFENTLNEEFASLGKTNARSENVLRNELKAPFTKISETDQNLPDIQHEIEGNPNTDNEKNDFFFPHPNLFVASVISYLQQKSF